MAERGGGGRVSYVSGSVVLDVDVFTPATIGQQPRIMEAIVLHGSPTSSGSVTSASRWS